MSARTCLARKQQRMLHCEMAGVYRTKPYDERGIMQPGMVTRVETRVRWVGKVGYHMEDLIEITDGAPVLMSDAFDNEQIFVI